MLKYSQEDKAIYINIPFCNQRCSYCHYIPNIKFGISHIPDEYLYLLKEQLNKQIDNENIKSIYIGGGTPSLLTDEQIKFIFSDVSFNLQNIDEISIEIHPAHMNFSENSLKYFTRCSIGIQSFNVDRLKNGIERYIHMIWFIRL